MRILSILPIALVTLRLSVVLADDDAAAPSPSDSAGDDDFDLDDEFTDDDPSPQMQGAGGPMGGGAPQVEDFDLELEETDRYTRMGTCFSYTIGRLQANTELVQRTAQEIMQHHGVKQQQAMTAVLSNWMMSCYMNIGSDELEQAAGTPFGAPVAIPEGKDEELFGHSPSARQTIRQASKRQWDLLQTSINENSKNMPQQERPKPPPAPAPRAQPASPLGGSMDSGTGFIYMIAVFGILFGVGTLVIFRLYAQEKGSKAEKDRGSKSERKKEKAEKQASKKRM